jgi:hypothetical protein
MKCPVCPESGAKADMAEEPPSAKKRDMQDNKITERLMTQRALRW